MSLVQWIVIVVALQRLTELILSNRNTAKLRAEGGVEFGASHYPLIVILHISWLAALFALTNPNTVVSLSLLSVFLLLQIGRIWVIVTLGERWTTRIIIIPDAPLIRHGPYRWLKHPNYLVIIGEIFVLPMAFGQWQMALIFSFANLMLLFWRVRIENLGLDSAAPH